MNNYDEMTTLYALIKNAWLKADEIAEANHADEKLFDLCAFVKLQSLALAEDVQKWLNENRE